MHRIDPAVPGVDRMPGTDQADRRASRRSATWLALAALLAGLALAVAHALTKIPHMDEGDLASGAVSLLDRGRIAFPMSWHYPPSIRDAYFSAPFYYWALAGWFAGFGDSLASYRLFHMPWYVLLVVGWTAVARGASTARWIVPMTLALVALDYDVINLSISRYDIVCAALNAAAMGAYVRWREAQLLRAIVIANACLAASAITHPYAIFGLIGCVALVLATGDWRRVRVAHVAAATAPYAIAFGAWALTIVDWAAFAEQRTIMLSTKRVGFADPLGTLVTDFTLRWWRLFAGWRPDVPAMMRAKTLFLVLWGVVLVCLVPLGDRARRPVRIAMLVYALATLLLLPFSDTLHLQVYNLHAVAGLSAASGVVLAELAGRGRPIASIAIAVAAGTALFAAAALGYRIRQRDLHFEHEAAVETVRRVLPPTGYLIAPSTFGFEFGYWRRVRSDHYLVSIASGALPDVIVESAEHGFRATPSRPLRCLPGVVVQDTTHYVEAPLTTPRSFYRVLERVTKPADFARASHRIVRACPAPATP